MDLRSFKKSLDADQPPTELSGTLKALWYEAKGDWHAAHKLTQAEDGADAAWVHAYLHRVEGDLDNAGYWYRRADRPSSSAALADEWDEIAGALLAR